jgi:hypothetical protein
VTGAGSAGPRPGESWSSARRGNGPEPPGPSRRQQVLVISWSPLVPPADACAERAAAHFRRALKAPTRCQPRETPHREEQDRHRSPPPRPSPAAFRCSRTATQAPGQAACHTAAESKRGTRGSPLAAAGSNPRLEWRRCRLARARGALGSWARRRVPVDVFGGRSSQHEAGWEGSTAEEEGASAPAAVDNRGCPGCGVTGST